jgi:hypothetical protein
MTGLSTLGVLGKLALTVVVLAFAAAVGLLLFITINLTFGGQLFITDARTRASRDIDEANQQTRELHAACEALHDERTRHD